MKIRNLDTNGDWMFGNGVGSYCRDQIALELNIKTKLSEWKRDCYWNQVAGIDWENRLEFNQQDALVSEIKSLIVKIDGVLEITELNANITLNRECIVKATIKTIFSSSFQLTYNI